MSRLTLALVLSASLNLTALVIWSLRAPGLASAAAVALPAPIAAPTAEAPVTVPAATASLFAAAPAATVPPLPDTAFVERLRAAGFPLEVIRAILRQRIDDHFAEREAAIRAAHPPAPYWSRRFGSNSQHRDSGPERIALRHEKRALLRTLLGDDAETADEKARRQRDYGSIDVAKVEQLIQLNTDFDALQHELRNQIQGLTLPADWDALLQLRADRAAAIAQLLTPDELATYELHSGDTASTLRTKLRWFRPTEDEFLALYTLQADLEHAHPLHPLPAVGSGDRLAEVQALRAQRAAAAADIAADIAALLGPERFAEYQLVTSDTYQQLRGVTDRLDLPAETAANLTRLFQTVTAEAQQRIAAVTTAEQSRHLQTLRATAVNQLAADLPDEARAAFDSALQRWIRTHLAPPRPTPAPRP